MFVRFSLYLTFLHYEIPFRINADDLALTIAVYGFVYSKPRKLLYRKIWLIYYPFDTKERKVFDHEI